MRYRYFKNMFHGHEIRQFDVETQEERVLTEKGKWKWCPWDEMGDCPLPEDEHYREISEEEAFLEIL